MLDPRGVGRGRMVLWALLFAILHGQPPLYSGNQNTYFVHGAARADYGELRSDWLANTRDATPVFSILVAFTYRHLSPIWFYAYYGILLGIYAFSMLGIFCRLTQKGANTLPASLFAVLFVAIHASALRWVSATVMHHDYLWYLQAGVAGQFVLGPGLQPSAFGVLLILSLYLFLLDRPVAAATTACVAVVCHTTYLLTVAVLILAYVVALVQETRRREAGVVALWAIVIVLHTAVYNYLVFGPSSPATFAEAQRILAHERLPHHAQPAVWFDAVTFGQLVMILAAIWLVRRTRLGAVLATCFVAGLGLSLVQVATGLDALALLFPWRVSVCLVPLATTILLARLVPWLVTRCHEHMARHDRLLDGALMGTVAVLLGGVLLVQRSSLDAHRSRAELGVSTFVKGQPSSGDVYLVPVEPPRFTLQGFRLSTGKPVYVDYKSHPYRDRDVLEWYSRVKRASDFYEGLRADDREGAMERLRSLPVTRVIVPSARELTGPGLEVMYRDAYYSLYRIVP